MDPEEYRRICLLRRVLNEMNPRRDGAAHHPAEKDQDERRILHEREGVNYLPHPSPPEPRRSSSPNRLPISIVRSNFLEDHNVIVVESRDTACFPCRRAIVR